MNKYHKILSLLQKRVLVMDGAYGTALLDKKYGNDKEIPDLETLENPVSVRRLHEKYLDAGADIIKTNSFNSNSFILKKAGLSRIADILAFYSSDLAKKTVDKYMASHPYSEKFVAASIYLMGAEKQFEQKEIIESYKSALNAHLKGGADIILYETITSINSMKTGLEALRELEEGRGSKIPVIVSFSPTKEGKLLSGEAVEEFLRVADKYEVLALGMNCGYSSHSIINHTKRLSGMTDRPIIVAPNAGLPDGRMQHLESPQQFADNMEELLREGLVNIVGGCCGTNPEYIKVLTTVVNEYRTIHGY